eukprot:2324886-Ditylum_brightwellii.AAC.1
MLAQYLHKTTPSHVAAAKYVLKYLKGNKNLSITFSTTDRTNFSNYLNFPPEALVNTVCNSNWGPQDVIKPREMDPAVLLYLFKP